jgi:hypothetical protein
MTDMKPDPLTEPPWDAVRKVHDHFAASAIAVCNTGEEVAHQLMMVNCDDEGRILQFAALPSELMSLFFKDGTSGKDMFAMFIRSLMKQGSPIREQFSAAAGFEPRLLVFICEAWALQSSSEEDIKALRENGYCVSKHPKRTEVLQVMLHTATVSAMSMNIIESKPKRHCVPGKFPTREEALIFSGRFAMQDQDPEGSKPH